jgi:phenylacetate-CoA ligase
MIPELSADELAALQLERLQRTLQHAYTNVPLYHRKFDAAGVHPDDCRSLDDLTKFPFTTKQDLRESYPYGMFAVAQNRISRIHASSGTTGQPTIVGYTENDIVTWSEVMARSLWAAGGRPGDKVHVAYGYGLFTGGLGAHYGAERLGCTVIPASGGMTARQVRLITDLRPDIVMVTPSYMLTLLDEFDRAGIDPAASSLRVGVFGAEPWTEQMRTEIESRLAIDAVDVYGLSEVIGPGVAQESVETKDGPHVWEDHFYPEVVDPATGQPTDERGDLVFTSLTKEAMPIIRYRTRDLTRLLPGTAHPPFRRMTKVTGRTDDLIILRGVNVFPTQIEEVILTTPGAAPHFQLVLSTVDRMDHLTVRVEADVDTSASVIATRIKDDIGISVAVEILSSGSLERSTGKIQRVVDHR